MTSKERVLKAIKHEEVDRLPIDLDGSRCTSIASIAYRNLRKFLRLPEVDIKIYDLMQNIAIVDDDVLDKFEVDTRQVRNLRPALNLSIKQWKKININDGMFTVPFDFNPKIDEEGNMILDVDGAIAVRPKTALYFDYKEFSIKKIESKKDVDEINLHLLDTEEIKWLEYESFRIRQKYPDKAILGDFTFGDIIEQGTFLFGWDKFMILLGSEPKLAHYMLDRILEANLENLCRYIKSVGNNIDILVFSEDMGTQQSLQYSPRIYREFLKPRQKIMFDFVKHNSDYSVFLHSCGSIIEIIPDLIEIGVEILNPVQTTAYGMDAQKLKNEFGEYLTFWGGGVDTQHVLPLSDPEDVRKDVRERIKIFSKDSGYVFNTIHNIQADIKPQNIASAFYEAVSYRN
ncbi:MAG: hypothetical protein M1371_10650 [Actinobacteria bacterium]|nr:hypothetical protein [Actinomycetota bacterium]MCL5987000.1 hypothetical protein [Actinomycetota bacterium]